MGQNWIKLRTNLWDDPRVAELCDRLDCGEATVIGGLVRLWSIADEHTEDGRLVGMTPRTLDRKSGLDGFADALQQVGWLEVEDGALIVPRFAEHNGQSAKQRAQSGKRQQRRRGKGNGNPRDSPRDSSPPMHRVTQVSRSQRDKSVTRIEESRLEESTGVYSCVSQRTLYSDRALFLWAKRAAADPDVPVRDSEADLLRVFGTAERIIEQHRRGKVRNPVGAFVALIRDNRDYITTAHEDRARQRLRRLRGVRPALRPPEHPDLAPQSLPHPDRLGDALPELLNRGFAA